MNSCPNIGMVNTSIKMMNAAAPEGTPPRRIRIDKFLKDLPAPPCLGEALRRVILQKYPDFEGITNDPDFQSVSTS